MTSDSKKPEGTPRWMKRLVRERMKETGEKYTKTLRDIKAEVAAGTTKAQEET